MKCPSCGYVSLGAADVCKKCGADLKPGRQGVSGVSPETRDDGIREEAWKATGEAGREPEKPAVSEPETIFSMDTERILNSDEIFEGIFHTSEPETASAPARTAPEPRPLPAEPARADEKQPPAGHAEPGPLKAGSEVTPPKPHLKPVGPPPAKPHPQPPGPPPPKTAVEPRPSVVKAESETPGTPTPIMGSVHDATAKVVETEPASAPGEDVVFDDFRIELDEMEPREIQPEVIEPEEIEPEQIEPVSPRRAEPREAAGATGPGQMEMKMDAPAVADFPEEAWGEEPVGILRRAGALAVDVGVIAAVVALFAAAAGLVLAFKGVGAWWLLGAFWISQTPVPLFVLATLVSAVYFIFFLWQEGQTPGARVFSLKVLCASGAPLSLHAAVLRWLAYLVSAVPLGLGFLWAFLDRDGLAWHDRLSGTMVVDASDESP